MSSSTAGGGGASVINSLPQQHDFIISRRQQSIGGNNDKGKCIMKNTSTTIPHAAAAAAAAADAENDHRLLTSPSSQKQRGENRGVGQLMANFLMVRWKLFRDTGLFFLLWPVVGFLFVAWHINLSDVSSSQRKVSFIIKNNDYYINPHPTKAAAAAAAASSVRLFTEKLGPIAPDYGDIEYQRLEAVQFARMIAPGEEGGKDGDDMLLYNTMKSKRLYEMDKETTSDDVDYRDESRFEPYDDLEYPGDGCYRLKWTYEAERYGTCNEFHSLSFDRMLTTELEEQEQRRIQYLGRGSFRETWMLTEESSKSKEEDCCVLKTNRYADHRYYKNYAYSQVRNEALCMLKTHSSKLTMSIYGYCGTSLLVEPGDEIEDWIVPNDWEYMSQDELDQIQQVDGDVVPQNNLTLDEKLTVATVMAESIALLHGNPDGLVVSHDIGFDQWLRSKKDGLIKLNDFNKARVLYWNPTENRYCKVYSHQVSSYRAPEEIYGGYIDETADVVSLGKFFYTIMTGLRVYYDKMSRKKAARHAFNGELPYIDPRYRNRSLTEGRLVEIMEQMWPYNSTDRVDIFTVVSHLRETARLAKSI